MALQKIGRGMLNTGVSDSSDATAITIDSSENVTFAGTVTSTGKITADAGIDIDNINIDGTTISQAGGSDLTIDIGGRIDLSADDNGEIRLFDGSSQYGQFKDDDNRLKIQGMISDADMLFVVNDGGSEITALTLDASEAGAATFNSKLLIGSTSDSFDNNSKIVLTPDSDSYIINNGQCLSLNRTSSHGVITGFYYNSSLVGSISSNANSLPSDKNFKRDISDLDLGLNLITKLKPSQYNYKIDSDDCPKMYGLIAQDLEESLTEVGVEKNSSWLLQHEPNDDEKQSDYSVDYLKLTPVLIKAIQELEARVKELEG